VPKDEDENDSVMSDVGASDLEQDDHDISGFDDDVEMEESNEEIIEDLEDNPTENVQAPSKMKGKKDSRNYSKNPWESFEVFDHKEAKMPSKIDFDHAGVGRASVKSFKEMQPEEILDHYWEPCMKYIIAMYNRANPTLKELTMGKLKAYYGITMFTYEWRHSDIRAYWGGGTYAGMPKPDFSKIMSYRDYMEIKRNYRFEDYTNPNSIPETDKMWKMRTLFEIFKKTLMESLPAPMQHISVDEAMIKYTGYRCPIVRAMPNKPIPRGIKLYVAVDNETGIPVNVNVCDDQFDKTNCDNIEGGQPGKQVTRLLEHLPGQGYIVYTDNWYTSIGLARVLKRMDQKISLIGTVRKERISDAIEYVALGARNKKSGKLARSKKPTKDTPKGTLKSACTSDGEIHVSGIMDTAAVYMVDSHYGSGNLVEITRKQKGQALPVQLLLPRSFQGYNEHMGGVDNNDQLRLGDHGTEGRGRAMKWTTRLHDGLHNMGRVAAYQAYRYCRKKKWGNMPSLSHAQFNERIISKYLYNNEWAAEKEVLNSGRRISLRVRKSAMKKLYPQDNLVEYHDLVEETEVDSGGRKKRKYCVACPVPESTVRDYSRRTSYYCKQCSEFAPKKVHLCPTCFGAYHNKKNQERGLSVGAIARKLDFN